MTSIRTSCSVSAPSSGHYETSHISLLSELHIQFQSRPCISFCCVTTPCTLFYLGTSERTRAFGTFPGNYVAPVWPPHILLAPRPPGLHQSLHPADPALTLQSLFSHLPSTLLHLVESDLHVSQNRGEGRDTVWFLTSPPCMSACVCSTETCRVFSHTPLERKEWMLMILFQIAENGLFCSTAICSCRKFAFLPSEQLNGSFWVPDTVWCCIQIFVTTVPSQTTAGSFLIRVAHFSGINVSFACLPQIILQISESTTGKFEETTWTSVDTCLK